jgi:hypothetical protein
MKLKVSLIKVVGLPLICILMSYETHSQVIHAGLKAGANYSWIRYEDSGYRDLTSVTPIVGFNAGVVASFKMKERFFLHTELIYSTKGRVTEGELGATDKVTYQYIELPLTYNLYFKGKLRSKSIKYFKWYAGIGPNFSYWLGAKGVLSNDELREYGVNELPYKVKFGPRPASDVGNTEVVYYEDVKRMQLGVNIGGGILLEPISGNKIALDVRFELGHTWLGTTESSDFVIPVTYEDNLKARNMGLRVSAMYMLEFNVDKKVRNRGKSTKKKSRL